MRLIDIVVLHHLYFNRTIKELKSLLVAGKML